MGLQKRNKERLDLDCLKGFKRHKETSSLPSTHNVLKQQLAYQSRQRIEQGREKPIDKFYNILFILGKSVLLENEQNFEKKLETPLLFFDAIDKKNLENLIKDVEVD